MRFVTTFCMAMAATTASLSDWFDQADDWLQSAEDKFEDLEGKFLSDTQGVFGDNIVMEPLEGKTGEPAALIFIIGAYCEQAHYMDHLKAIQEKVPFPLYVGIPHIIHDLPIPVGLGVYINNMKDELDQKYGFKSDKYFFGGHSLGASSVSSWAHGNIDQVEGVMLWGSYVAHSVHDPAKNYGAPVLTVGAELDGWMARITRIAQSYDQMKSSSVGYSTSKYTHPVVVIPGIGHASFLTGLPPPAVRDSDIRQFIPEDEAIKEISDASAAFLTITRLGKNSKEGLTAMSTIDHMIDQSTAPLLDPILELYELEGAPFMSSFKNVTPWNLVATQHVVGDAMKDSIKITDEYKTFIIASGEFTHAKPSIKHDTGDNHYDTDIMSYSHSAYNIRTNENIDAANFYAATEVGSKMKSREAIYKYYDLDFEGVDEPTCQEINKLAYDLVISRYNHTNALARFHKYGQPMEFIEDSQSTAGITWANRPIITTNTTTTYQVQSRILISPIDFVVPAAAGMLYCKLISPARILEWMIVDGLKKNLYWAPYQPMEDFEEAPFTQ